MADGDGLENRCPRKRTVGSNPTPSAKNRNSKNNKIVKVKNDVDTNPTKPTPRLPSKRR